MKKLRDLKWELDLLRRVDFDPEVVAVKKKVLADRQPKIEALERQIKELQGKRPAKRPRWPETTPPHILEACEEYWKGTTEFYSFRIHLWNSKSVWTSYPSGGYSNNGGWNPTPVNYDLISLTERNFRRAKVLANITQRTSTKELSTIMLEKTKELPAPA
jgi:hypothetical protein